MKNLNLWQKKYILVFNDMHDDIIDLYHIVSDESLTATNCRLKMSGLGSSKRRHYHFSANWTASAIKAGRAVFMQTVWKYATTGFYPRR